MTAHQGSGTELWTYTLTSPSIRLPVVNSSWQQGGHCWPSIVRQNVMEAPGVTSLVCCWLRMLGISWHSFSFSPLISSLPLLLGSCLFSLTCSFPGSSSPNLNSLHAEAEYAISLFRGIFPSRTGECWTCHLYLNQVLSIFTGTPRDPCIYQVAGCFLAMEKFCFGRLCSYAQVFNYLLPASIYSEAIFSSVAQARLFVIQKFCRDS